MAIGFLNVEAIFTKATENTCSLVGFDVERGRPEGFGSNPVGKFVDRRAELVNQIVDFIEALLGSGLSLRPGGELDRHVGD